MTAKAFYRALALTIAVFLTGGESLHAANVSGEVTEFRSANGLVEQCIRLADMPGAHYGKHDRRDEIRYCGLDFTQLARLDFEAPDEDRFPALRLAREAMRAGGLTPCTMNAAHEVALDAFIAGQIGFLDMAGLVEDTVSGLDDVGEASTLDDVFAADRAARRKARSLIETHLLRA